MQKLLSEDYFFYRDFAKINCYRYCFIKFDICTDYIPAEKPHGNKQKEKQMRAYRKPYKSTLQSLREISDIEKSKSAYEAVRKSIGKLATTAALPKNYQQAVYAGQAVSSQFKSVNGNRDELMRTIFRCKKLGENFVREVQSAPEEISVLATDTQISDIVRFCVLPNLAECTPLSVDLTFNLGEFYVTVTSYKNKKLKIKKEIIPCILVKFKFIIESWFHLNRFIGSFLKQIEKKVSGLKIFGSSQEDNLAKVFKEEFPEANNFQCFRHFKQNIE